MCLVASGNILQMWYAQLSRSPVLGCWVYRAGPEGLGQAGSAAEEVGWFGHSAAGEGGGWSLSCCGGSQAGHSTAGEVELRKSYP